MIQITQLKLPVTHTEEQLENKIRKMLRLSEGQELTYRITRRSVDARERPDIRFVYTVVCDVPGEKKILFRNRHNNIASVSETVYRAPESGDIFLPHRPVIAGSGPAGLFCAWKLAEWGYRPIVLEQGDPVEERTLKVRRFWETGILDTRSNVQFGEGGAGTFSDGKLNTQVKDKFGRNEEVLRIFCAMGAPEEIRFDAKPHLGTDQLVHIVSSMRRHIESLGGEVRFGAKVTDLLINDGSVNGVVLESGEEIPAECVVIAIGHSARDTFSMLYGKQLRMENKSFAVGVRMEHPQELINRALYGEPFPEILGPASYRLARTEPGGRGVYSFCMCPGGYVVNASSEEKMLAVNGMSYSGRDSGNANSAIVVTVTPGDYLPYSREGLPEALSGIAFQRHLEKLAFELAGGCVPVQRLEDFRAGRKGSAGGLSPCIKGSYSYENVRRIFPEEFSETLIRGILSFDEKISGFALPDALLSGVESRTSSPVRILRDNNLESNIRGIYPCGEGAGYAGGITSAAMDGIRAAEAIVKKYSKP